MSVDLSLTDAMDAEFQRLHAESRAHQHAIPATSPRRGTHVIGLDIERICQAMGKDRADPDALAEACSSFAMASSTPVRTHLFLILRVYMPSRASGHEHVQMCVWTSSQE